jgi:hypothetical protein
MVSCHSNLGHVILLHSFPPFFFYTYSGIVMLYFVVSTDWIYPNMRVTINFMKSSSLL